jgi:alpha-ketoglutarate-dependent taurine dioxygenase
MRAIHQELQNYGFSLFPHVCQEDLEDIARRFGPIEVDRRNSKKIREIQPQSKLSANPNTLSSRHGTGSFPFHTDCAHWSQPPRYLLLYCVNPGFGNRPTLVLDTKEWNWSDHQKRALCNEVWKRALKEPRLCTVAEKADFGLSIRFDEACMEPVTTGAKKLLTNIRKQIRRSSTISILWSPGDLLVLDNHRVLHSRGESNRPDPDRLLKRILVGASHESMGL